MWWHSCSDGRHKKCIALVEYGKPFMDLKTPLLVEALIYLSKSNFAHACLIRERYERAGWTSGSKSLPYLVTFLAPSQSSRRAISKNLASSLTSFTNMILLVKLESTSRLGGIFLRSILKKSLDILVVPVLPMREFSCFTVYLVINFLYDTCGLLVSFYQPRAHSSHYQLTKHHFTP